MNFLAVEVVRLSRRPIIVGPWISEMGFEVLYWLPYLAHFCHTREIEADRLWIVTRGGAGAWYGVLPSHHIELYDYVPPRDLRLQPLARSAQQGVTKHYAMSAWEQRLVALLAERYGLRRYHVLHPSQMYLALDSWWDQQTMGFGELLRRLRINRITAPPVPVGMSLPEQYVAVRWYARATWPLTEELLDWTRAVTTSIAKRIPVVVLQCPQYLDDHVDFPPPEGPNITVMRPPQWRENLAVQSAIIKRAKAFVGTWGGIAQLAVRLEVPTAAYHWGPWKGMAYPHRVLTEWIAVQQGTPIFIGRPEDGEFCRSVLPDAIELPTPPRGSSS